MLKELGIPILALALFLGSILGVVLLVDAVKCSNRWSDFESRYVVMGGCQVKVNDKWYPEDRVRTF